jgi:hypothetical protein
MFTIDPLLEARERSNRFQAEALAEHHRKRQVRPLFAHALRRMADRVDPGTAVAPLSSPHG